MSAQAGRRPTATVTSCPWPTRNPGLSSSLMTVVGHDTFLEVLNTPSLRVHILDKTQESN